MIFFKALVHVAAVDFFFSCWFMLLFVVHVVSTAGISVVGLVAADCLIVGLLCCCCSFFSCHAVVHAV